MIEKYVNNNKHKAVSFISLGQLRYLSAIQYMDAVIGNSSSGIIEVPAFNIPTVNIGDRQQGRITGQTIINCEPTINEISKAIDKALLFDKTKQYEHPYGEGNASEKILSILKQIKKIDLKKKFFDIDFNY